MSFAITVLPAIDGHRWLCIEGPVDAATAGDVRAVLNCALSMPARRLTIDLRHAQIDEAGRACLAEMTSYASGQGVAVRVMPTADAVPDGPRRHTQPPAPELLAPAA